MPDVQCLQCSATFHVGQSRIREGKAKFCSTLCMHSFWRQHGKPHEDHTERFWNQISKTETCWLWTGSCAKGYGRLKVGMPNPGSLRVHRFSWELHYGPIPPGLCVLHHCDVSICVHPSHLFLGTLFDNNTDRHRKGGYAEGPQHHQARLSAEDVKAIRVLQGQSTATSVGKRYQVSLDAIRKIWHGKTYKNVHESHGTMTRFHAKIPACEPPYSLTCDGHGGC